MNASKDRNKQFFIGLTCWLGIFLLVFSTISSACALVDAEHIEVAGVEVHSVEMHIAAPSDALDCCVVDVSMTPHCGMEDSLRELRNVPRTKLVSLQEFCTSMTLGKFQIPQKVDLRTSNISNSTNTPLLLSSLFSHKTLLLN